MDKEYVFPDEDDDLTNYAGESAQLVVPTGLLQDISKYTYIFIISLLIFLPCFNG